MVKWCLSSQAFIVFVKLGNSSIQGLHFRFELRQQLAGFAALLRELDFKILHFFGLCTLSQVKFIQFSLNQHRQLLDCWFY